MLVQVFSLIILIASSILGIFVYLANRHSSINKSFSLICFSIALWIFTNLMVDLSRTEAQGLLWTRLTLFGVTIAPLFFIYFTTVFPKKTIKINKYQWLFLIILAIIIIFLIPTKFNVESFKFIHPEQISSTPGLQPISDVEIKFGSLYTFFMIYFLVCVAIGIRLLIKNYRTGSKKERLKIKYLLLGFLITIMIAITTNAILPILGNASLSGIGPSSTIFFLVFTIYAIVTRDLFNIRVVLVQLVVLVIGVILLMQILFNESLQMRILNGSIFILFCFFGWLLIRSVLREIKLREDLALANKELKKLDEAKTEFLSIASHQLRTPLTAIKGYLGMIDEGIYGKVSENVHKTIHKVDDSNERLIRLVNSLLDISRLEMGRMEFDLEKVNIEEIVESIVDELHVAAKKKGLNLVFEHPKEEIPEITVDPLKIRQVIINLVDNAIKYTYKGEIIVNCESVGDKVRISVSDTGMGIARKEVGEIFKIYRRGTGVRLFPEGSGVGLYVARKLVEAHHGKIWVESKGKGKGSIFFIELPTRNGLGRFLTKF